MLVQFCNQFWSCNDPTIGATIKSIAICSNNDCNRAILCKNISNLSISCNNQGLWAAQDQYRFQNSSSNPLQPGPTMHYGLSPVGNRKLRKTHLGFHFLAIHIFQTEIFEISFTFVLYLGTSWNPSQQQQNFHKNQLEFQQACWRMWIKKGDH